MRAAEPDASSPIGWRVNTWVKQGILLGFRFGDIVDASMDHGRWPFYDKDTLPLKKPGLAAGVRIVPGGSAIRDGAYLAPGVICMPPMYVNIGAYVGEESLIDSHALVGSCAQVGARVHVSAAAQIGGVIEPVGALPVIIEDDVLVGGNTGHLRRARSSRARAVIAAGTVLTGSTPVYDLVRGEIIKPTADRPLVVPEGAVVVPGARAVTAGQGPGVGPVARDAGDREVPRLAHRHAHGARSVDPVIVGLTRALVDIDSTTGREGAAGRWLADYLRGRGFAVTEQPVDDPASTSSRPSATRRSCSRRTSTACRRSFRAASRATGCTAAARATRRAFSPRRSPPPSGCGARAKRASACCSSSAKSAAATARKAANDARRRLPLPRSTASRPTTGSASRRAAFSR